MIVRMNRHIVADERQLVNLNGPRDSAGAQAEVCSFFVCSSFLYPWPVLINPLNAEPVFAWRHKH